MNGMKRNAVPKSRRQWNAACTGTEVKVMGKDGVRKRRKKKNLGGDFPFTKR